MARYWRYDMTATDLATSGEIDGRVRSSLKCLNDTLMTEHINTKFE